MSMYNNYYLVVFIFIFLFSCNKNYTHDSSPNIIIIIADDLGYADISITNLAEDVRTPNIDNIALNGVRFSNAYDNSPICNQSRIGIITGSYPQRLGSYWYSAEGLHDSKFITIPELLKSKSYTTGYVGKIHYGSKDSDTTHRSFPLNHGFDYYFGHTSPRKHYFNHKKEIETSFLESKKKHKRYGQSLRQGSLWENTKRIDTIAFFTRLVGKKSVEFIKRNVNKNFYLQIAFNATHNFTHQLPKEYLEKYNLKGYHDWNPALEEYYEWYKKSRYPNNNEGRAHYLGQLYYMDKEIGRILNTLEEKKLIKNTLIFFISDNGGSTPIYSNNYPLRGSKYLLYEGGIRVQMLVSYPEKFQKNKVYSNMVSAMDILPTICSSVKIEIPDHIDGLDLTPLLKGENDTIAHDILFWDTGHEIAVRKGRWKLRKAYDNKHAKYEMVNLELGEFLYNLQDDIREENNLRDVESKIRENLEKKYSRWKSEVENDDNNM